MCHSKLGFLTRLHRRCAGETGALGEGRVKEPAASFVEEGEEFVVGHPSRSIPIFTFVKSALCNSGESCLRKRMFGKCGAQPLVRLNGQDRQVTHCDVLRFTKLGQVPKPAAR